jgi:hypothetical protein
MAVRVLVAKMLLVGVAALDRFMAMVVRVVALYQPKVGALAVVVVLVALGVMSPLARLQASVQEVAAVYLLAVMR